MNRRPYKHSDLVSREETNARLERSNLTPRFMRQQGRWPEPKAKRIDHIIFWTALGAFLVLRLKGWI